MYKRIFLNTISSILNKRVVLFRALLLPSLLLIILNALFIKDFHNLYIAVPFFILSLIVSITIAISTHRILLLQDSKINTWGLFSFEKREYEYFKASLSLMVIVIISAFIGLILFGIPTWILGYILGEQSSSLLLIFLPLAVLIYVCIILSRVSLIFPSIALEKSMGFKESWDKTSEHKVLCFITIVIVPIVFAFGLNFLISNILSFNNLLYYCVNAILGVFTNVLIISALSNTYKYIFEENEEEIEDLSSRMTLKINDFNPIILSFNTKINFANLKEDLKSQYGSLGFTNKVLDEEASFLLEHEENKDTFVSLKEKDNTYIIETLNTQNPDLFILEEEDRI
ncbi:MAG: hypothetical protein COA66_03770 [Arcobacter sp.]|nr:MAG: hypothetical protein COA66_03770 [Arcobacter sp.]